MILAKEYSDGILPHVLHTKCQWERRRPAHNGERA
jgi:hypothetical protein